MKVAAGIEMLEISAQVLGRQSTVHPTVFWDEETVILVDTGHPGQLPLIRREMEKAGIPLQRLNKVILTHQDIDHIGSLPEIISAAPQTVDVLAHALEKPHIQGEKPLLKLSPKALAAALQALPPDLPEEMRRAYKARLENPPKAQVNRTIADGEELKYCGGITVIHTPGHVPGHICLYHSLSRTLISGDAMNLLNGELIGPAPQYTADLSLAYKSLNKLAAYDIEKVITYHGGLYDENPNQRIAELATL